MKIRRCLLSVRTRQNLSLSRNLFPSAPCLGLLAKLNLWLLLLGLERKSEVTDREGEFLLDRFAGSCFAQLCERLQENICTVGQSHLLLYIHIKEKKRNIFFYLEQQPTPSL